MARRQLYHGQPSNTSAAVYTATNVYTTITAATVFNGSGGAVTLDVWVVATGGSVADSNKIYKGLSVADGETKGLQFLVAHTMDKNDELHMQASAATSLTVLVSGDEQG